MQADAKIPLVLVPGMLCNAMSWQAQSDDLADIADIHIVDLRGHETFADIARAILAKGEDRFALAGHSMGARVALEVCRLAPERVVTLALLDTGVHPLRTNEAQRRQSAIDRAEEIGLSGYADEWIDQILPGCHAANNPLRNVMHDMIISFSLEDFRKMTRCSLTRVDAAPILPEITCHTLVACGADDHYSPPSQHAEIAELLPDAVLHIIENCGHMAPMEKPRTVSKLMRDWILKQQGNT